MRNYGIQGSVKQTPSQLQQHNNFVLNWLAEEQYKNSHISHNSLEMLATA